MQQVPKDDRYTFVITPNGKTGRRIIHVMEKTNDRPMCRLQSRNTFTIERLGDGPVDYADICPRCLRFTAIAVRESDA